MGVELLGLLGLLIIAVTVYKIVELKHSNRPGIDSDEFRHLLAEEMSDRDDKAVALEERIRVLEKIVTENHKSNSLSEEIDHL